MQHKNVNCNFSEIYLLELQEMTVTSDKTVLFFYGISCSSIDMQGAANP